jgi:PAS domain S-box-containing protein
LYVSRSIKDVLGYEPADLVGKNYSDFLVADNGCNSDVEAMRSRRFNGDANHTSIRVVFDKSGQKRVLKIQTYGKVDDEGNVGANHAIAQDVTNESHLSERLQELIKVESTLKEREKTVLELVLSGSPNKLIARRLSITERAIEMVRARLMKKFAVTSAAELIAMATELATLRNVLQLSA